MSIDVLEAIRARKSTRAFKPDPVPQEVLRRFLEDGLRAPSWANTQPWELAIIGGQTLAKVKRALAQKMASGQPISSDIPYPAFSGAYQQRREESGARMLDAQGIPREDKTRRQKSELGIIQFLGAPNGLIVYIDRSLSQWSLLDVGLFLQNLSLAALGYGLGTCIEAMVIRYPEVLREHLHIPTSKLIVCGMAIGYPDTTSPINKVQSPRLPLEAVATWHGFER